MHGNTVHHLIQTELLPTLKRAYFTKCLNSLDAVSWALNELILNLRFTARQHNHKYQPEVDDIADEVNHIDQAPDRLEYRRAFQRVTFRIYTMLLRLDKEVGSIHVNKSAGFVEYGV